MRSPEIDVSGCWLALSQANLPNQSLQPTAPSVTFPAGAGTAPADTVADL